MSEAGQRRIALKKIEAEAKGKQWGQDATKYLEAKSRGEWAPWLGIQSWLGDKTLESVESDAYGAWSAKKSAETESRRKAYEQALEFAKARAAAREQIQDAIAEGQLTGPKLEQAQTIVGKPAALDPAWLQMYPQNQAASK